MFEKIAHAFASLTPDWIAVGVAVLTLVCVLYQLRLERRQTRLAEEQTSLAKSQGALVEEQHRMGKDQLVVAQNLLDVMKTVHAGRWLTERGEPSL